MNYTLNLQLEGADKASAALDDLMKKVGSLGSGGGNKISFSDWLSHDPMTEGQNRATEVAKGVTKKAKSLNPLDSWGKSVFKSISESWNDAVRHAKANPLPESPSIKGLEETGGKELAKIFGLPDINDLDEKKSPNYKGAGMADLARNKFATPQTPAWMTPDFFKKQVEIPKMDWKKVLIGLGLGASNPYIGSRALSDELGKGSAGGVAGGLFGKGGIAGFSEIYLAFKLFKFSVEVFKKTVETAAHMYSKALQSGLGLGFTVKRSMLAEIMGVSETDVFRFGAQMAYLNPKIEFAVAELTRTNKPLTQASWGLKIMGENGKALAAQLGSAMAPAMNQLISDFNSFLVVLGKSHAIDGLGKVLDVTLTTFVIVIGGIEILFNGFILTLKSLAFAIAEMIVTVVNLAAKIPGAGKLGIHALDDSAMRKDYMDAVKSYGEEIRNYDKNFSGAKTDIPNPMAQMKQLPVSSWEKMGLVTMGGSNNYAKETAKNTKEMALGIKTIAKFVAGGGSGGGHGAGGSWGMSPLTSNS